MTYEKRISAANSNRTRFSEFAAGFRVPGKGLSLLRANPRLWPYAIPSILINLAITTVVLLVLVGMVMAFMSMIHPWFLSHQEGASWMLWLVLELMTLVALVLVCVAAAFVTWKLLSGIICGHQYGKLARETEMILGAPDEELAEVPFSYQVYDTLRDLTNLSLTHLVLIGVGTIPGIGAPLAVGTSFYRTWFMLGFDLLDHPLAMRAMRRSEKLEFARRHRCRVLGMGAAVFLIEFVPVLSALLLTTSVIGAVQVHRELAAQDTAQNRTRVLQH